MKRIITDINNNIYIQEEDISLNNINDKLDNVIEISNDIICPWLGLGGAITESSAYNYSKLDSKKKSKLLELYYSNNGLNYNLGRISIGSCDFSIKSYQLSRKKDLSDFNIDNDNKYIIPMLKDIYQKKKIDLIASPWTPPTMYKNSMFLTMGGKLKKEYYLSYAKYLRLFINTYNNLGFNIKYLTIQNEPGARQRWESCLFSLDEQKEFIYNYLTQELEGSNTSILLHDHNKETLNLVYDYLYKENTNVKGIAFHWYNPGYYNLIKDIRNKDNNILLINSETCCGYSTYNEKEWINDAKLYVNDIINDINSGCNAYLDWNIFLNYYGGPNHKKNYCKSPIILNKEENDLIITPIYYYLYHISKLNGNITYTNSNNNNLLVVSSLDNKNRVIIIFNPNNENYDYNIVLENKYISDRIKSNSIITYII